MLRGACGYVCVCVCACLYAALTGSRRYAGKALRRVIMRSHRRVRNGVLWVFLFVLAISPFPPPPPSKVVRMNEISKRTWAARARWNRASHLHTGIDASGGSAVTSLGSRRPSPNINMRLKGSEEEPS